MRVEAVPLVADAPVQVPEEHLVACATSIFISLFQCVRAPLLGKRFCELHLCPVCMQEKESGATGCPAHDDMDRAQSGGADPAPRCAWVSEKGHCSGTCEPGYKYCRRHLCPVCGASKASDAAACPEHQSAGVTATKCAHTSERGRCRMPVQAESSYCEV